MTPPETLAAAPGGSAAARRERTPKAAAALILFGASGDLARRMLWPSLYFLDSDGLLDPQLRLIGAAREPMTRDAFIAMVEASIRDRAGDDFETGAFRTFAGKLDYASLDVTTGEGFEALASSVEAASGLIHYASLSPSLYGELARRLAEAGLAGPSARILIEKPLGRDLESCRAVNAAIAEAFPEERTFRVDHYLGKETVQNILALRFANALFEPVWNSRAIDHVQITIAEAEGAAGRHDYYDDYGALRDMVQNHLLQLVCLIAMEPPSSLEPDAVRNEKVKVLRSLRPIRGANGLVVRGQYRGGVVQGGEAQGYPQEGGAERTETFVAVRADIDNWRWAGTPFFLRTGKRLPERRTEIVIQFRQVPHSIFDGVKLASNRLVIRLQPQEDVSLRVMNKTPGLDKTGMKLEPLELSLSLTDAYRGRRRIAYERLILDALEGRSTLFVRRDEIEAAWAWIDGIADGWTDAGPEPYAAGTWGPAASAALIGAGGRSWL